MIVSSMAASEKSVLAISGDEGGDCISHQMGDQKIPINSFSNGQESNLGIIINQYGELMGEYSRLDDELWFSKPEDGDEAMAESNEGLQLNFTPTYERTVDLEKPSTFVDNSVSDGGTTFAKESSSSLKDSSLDKSQTSSPVSVLQRRRSCSKMTTRAITRARSKRNRSVSCNSQKGVQSLGKAFVAMEHSESFHCGSPVESPPLDEITEPIPAKQVRTKKISELLQSCPGEMNQNLDPELELPKKAVKKCLHCESTKTPQWREGPMGQATLCNACGVQFRCGRLFPDYRPCGSPKKAVKKSVKKCLHCESTKTPQWREGPMGIATLCNACGVQFRYGRLFPEYRPLKSPTYDPSLHSHLPKKVEQMRMSMNTEKCGTSGNAGQLE